jgi:dihydrofolate reductase
MKQNKNKIILYIATSLDGFIANKTGLVDFLDKYNDSGEDYGYYKFLDSIQNVILGNTTYKEFGAPYKDKKIFVFSKTKQKNTKEITFVNEDIVQFSKKLQGNTWMVGGASIFNEFLKHNLIDKFIITVIPVILGKGIPLFNEGTEKKLSLINVKSYNFGVVQVKYIKKN